MNTKKEILEALDLEIHKADTEEERAFEKAKKFREEHGGRDSRWLLRRSQEASGALAALEAFRETIE